MSDSNELIASDDGLGNPSLSTAGKYAIIDAALGFVISFAFVFSDGAKYWGMFYYLMIILGIGCVIWGIWVQRYKM